MLSPTLTAPACPTPVETIAAAIDRIVPLQGLPFEDRLWLAQNSDEVVAQRDRPVSVVRHDQPDRHYSVRQVINTKDGFLFFRVVGLNGDRDVLFVVNFNGRIGGGRLNGRNNMVVGGGCRQGHANDQKRQPASNVHRARLYHLRVRQQKGAFRLACSKFSITSRC